MSTELDDWIARIRSRDAITFEEAFHEQWPAGPEVVPRLLAEMRASHDSYTRGKFIEILGEIGGTAVLGHLAKELAHDDQGVRSWAVSSLRRIGGPDADCIVEDHLAVHPDDDA